MGSQKHRQENIQHHETNAYLWGMKASLVKRPVDKSEYYNDMLVSVT